MNDMIVRVPDHGGKTFRDGLTTLEKARFFAGARASAKQGYWGRDCFERGFQGYKPTLGGLIVVNDDDPKVGFEKRQDAVRAAQRFRAGAAKFAASADTHPKGGDVKQAPSLMSGAVPNGETPK